jgi:hypothetical protein
VARWQCASNSLCNGCRSVCASQNKGTSGRTDVEREESQLIAPGTKFSLKKTCVGVGASILFAGAASVGLSAGTAQAEPGFIPAYHWCPGQYYDPGWGPNWDQNVCHDDYHRDNDNGYNDYRGGPPPPPQWAPQYAAPGNYYTPPGYNGPPPPPGGWQAPPFCIPFVTCPPT